MVLCARRTGAREVGRTNLEHLNEGYAEVKVGQVSADQAQAEEETNGQDGAEVDAPSHGNGMPGVENLCEAGHDLSHDGCECEMPAGESDGYVGIVRRGGLDKL